MRKDIEDRFNHEAKTLPDVRAKFMSAVKRWEYSTQEIWSYHDLRFWCKDDALLPNAEGAFYTCGFDEADNPIVLQAFGETAIYGKPGTKQPAVTRVPTKDLAVEEFIAHHGNSLEVTKVLWGKVEKVFRLTFRDRLLVEEELFQAGQYLHTRYEYEGRKIVLQQSISEKGLVFFEIKCGPNGYNSYYRIRRDGTRLQLYQPWPKGVTSKSVKETIRARLCALVPQIVNNSGLKEAIYCVALAYDGEGNDALPPTIGIGLESERERWLAEHGKKARDWVWNPAEFRHYEKSHTQIEDEKLEEACDLLNSKLAESDSAAPAIKLLIEVATELNRYIWPETIQRTQDFVVYAVDYEMGDLRKNLKACLPADRLALLRAKKLL